MDSVGISLTWGELASVLAVLGLILGLSAKYMTVTILRDVSQVIDAKLESYPNTQTLDLKLQNLELQLSKKLSPDALGHLQASMLELDRSIRDRMADLDAAVRAKMDAL